jgi:hypothetical protein
MCVRQFWAYTIGSNVIGQQHCRPYYICFGSLAEVIIVQNALVCKRPESEVLLEFLALLAWYRYQGS